MVWHDIHAIKLHTLHLDNLSSKQTLNLNQHTHTQAKLGYNNTPEKQKTEQIALRTNNINSHPNSHKTQ